MEKIDKKKKANAQENYGGNTDKEAGVSATYKYALARKDGGVENDSAFLSPPMSLAQVAVVVISATQQEVKVTLSFPHLTLKKMGILC